MLNLVIIAKENVSSIMLTRRVEGLQHFFYTRERGNNANVSCLIRFIVKLGQDCPAINILVLCKFSYGS